MHPIEKMCRDHFNEPVLALLETGRLIGFAEDDHDYYLIIRYPKYPDGRISYHSAVGGYVFLGCLRGQDAIRSKHTDETWDDYYRIDSVLTLNGCPPAEEFIRETLPPHERSDQEFDFDDLGPFVPEDIAAKDR